MSQNLQPRNPSHPTGSTYLRRGANDAAGLCCCGERRVVHAGSITFEVRALEILMPLTQEVKK